MKFPKYFELELLNIQDLKIDERYQRDVQSNSRYIGENFNVYACGAIIVGLRRGEEYYIVDGLQRYTGAKTAGYTNILALVFKSSGVMQEANMFSMLNGKHRRKVSPSENFKAELEGKNEDAVKINDIITRNGFRLQLNSNNTAVRWPLIRSVRTLEQIYDEGDEVGLDTTLRLLKTIWEPDPYILKEEFLKGFWTFYNAVYEKENFDEEKMIRKFSKEEPVEIIRNAAREMIEKSFANFRRSKFIQLELLKIYNKRTKANERIEI